MNCYFKVIIPFWKKARGEEIFFQLKGANTQKPSTVGLRGEKFLIFLALSLYFKENLRLSNK